MVSLFKKGMCFAGVGVLNLSRKLLPLLDRAGGRVEETDSEISPKARFYILDYIMMHCFQEPGIPSIDGLFLSSSLKEIVARPP
jgi:hypothetical protein